MGLFTQEFRAQPLPDEIGEAHLQRIHRAFDLTGKAVPAGLVDFTGAPAVQAPLRFFPGRCPGTPPGDGLKIS